MSRCNHRAPSWPSPLSRHALRVLCIALSAFAGCAGLPRDEAAQSGESHKSAIRIQGLAQALDAELEAMRFEITPVDCSDGSTTGAPRATTRPLESSSTQRVSELFEVVPAGCYDISVTPLDAAGTPSATCASARKSRVEVFESKTTEVMLLAQCQGHDPGALEIIAELNHEPEIVDLSTEDAADFACGVPTRLCASAKDVDSDPLEFDLLAPDSCEVADEAAGAGERCWTLSCDAGTVALTLRVYDLVLRDDQLVRIEDWFAAEGRDDESHAEAQFDLRFSGRERWPDADADGYGDATAAPIALCDGDDETGLSADDTDCDDGDPRVHPGAAEVCGDGVDNDCDAAEDCAPCATPVACTIAAGANDTARCFACGGTVGAFCFRVAGGGTLCSDDFWCAGKPSCNTSEDCAPSEVCVIDSCCGAAPAGVCAAAKLECSLDAGVSAAAMSALGTASGKR